MIRTPARGFAKEEFKCRVARAQARMADENLAALLFTTEPEIRYFTGFLTRFWESPTRPWFLVLPSSGEPVAVIPSIGVHLMEQTWIGDIRSWNSPDYVDDGIGLLAETLVEFVPEGEQVGVPDQRETQIRMPLEAFRRLESLLTGRPVVGDRGIIRDLRMVKSRTEIEKIATACAIAERAFGRVSEIAGPGKPLSAIFRDFQILCLSEGADWVAYLAGAAAEGGYSDVISPATDVPLTLNDVLMLDTGLVWDGYFCDINRNYAIGTPSTIVEQAHSLLIEAVARAVEIARPGARICDLYHAMDQVVNPNGSRSEPGRLGHGLGMQLTEWPSITARDRTPLVTGMVMTLEPGIDLGCGRILVHEENIAIDEKGAELLSTFESGAIRRIAIDGAS